MFSMFGIGPPTANEIGTNTNASSQNRHSRSASRKLRPDATAAARLPARPSRRAGIDGIVKIDQATGSADNERHGADRK